MSSGIGLSLLALGSFAAAEGDTSRWSRSGEGSGIELSLPVAVEPARRDPRLRTGVSRLLIRCRDRKPELGLVSGLLAGHGEWAVSVTVRLDQDAATEQPVLVMRCRDASAEAYVLQQGRLTRTLRPPFGRVPSLLRGIS